MNNSKTHTRDYVDSLFSGYEENAGLKDFKEELLSNLDEKIANFMQKNMNEEEAYQKAVAQLGDISTLADELALKKRREVFEEAYMDIKTYMTPLRVLLYVGCGLLAAFGIIVAGMVYFAERMNSQDIGSYINLSGVFGVLLVFITMSVAGFTFLGLTQESATLYPMKKKSALLRTLATALISFGILLFPLTFVSTGGFMEAIAVLIPFVLPGTALLAFLVLREKDRSKPWVRHRREEMIKQEMESFNNPDTAREFGLVSGAIWIFALALFFVITFSAGLLYSWTVFLFAAGTELVALSRIGKGALK
ncbi:MAG: permease prefix domain 1-containing protein [Treponema sp.]|nr:permease prefix domain 1-containing protein [Treponema sp.]